MKAFSATLALTAILAIAVCALCKANDVQRRRQNAGSPATQPAQAPVFVGDKPDEWKSYQELHAYILDRFVRSDGFGISRVPRMQDDARYKLIYVEATRYRVGTVQLISLNRGGKPFVYVMEFADPSKSLLKESKHRPLDGYETDAIKELQSGKEVVLTGNGPGRELIGAVRAATSCVKCHDVKEGTLLGAFRYPLVRAGQQG